MSNDYNFNYNTFLSVAASVARRATGTVPCDAAGLAMAVVLAAGTGAAAACGCSGGVILAAGACCVCVWRGAGCAALVRPGAVVMRRVGAESAEAAACVLKRPDVGALRLILRCGVRGPTRVSIFQSSAQ